METENTNGHIPPIFILSCGRAGSTLLRYIIDTHPDICSPAELHLGRLCGLLVNMCEYLSLGSKAENRPLIYAKVNRLMSEWIGDYVQMRGKRFWCEKSPDNLGHLPVLKNVFSDAKYICLHRNCMDVVHSTLEMAEKKYFVTSGSQARNEKDVCLHVDNWVSETGTLLEFEQQNADRCIRVRYEDLINAPAEISKRIFEFIGLDWDEKILDAVFSTHHPTGPGDPKALFARTIHKKSIGKGSAISRRDITDDLLQKMNDLLETLGYPLVGPDWDQAPSPYIEAFAQGSEDEDGTASADTNDGFANFFPRWLESRAGRLQHLNGKGTCKFVITGEDENAWVIDLNAREVQIKADDRVADCTITIMQNDLIKMVNGELNPGEAFLQGKAQVAGNVNLAATVGQFLFRA